jgi:Icc-related predicted phosphoesterase
MVRFVIISDTHGRHRDYTGSLPAGDILVHCGDFSAGDAEGDARAELRDLNRWLGEAEQQRFAHRIVICGNHEFGTSDLAMRKGAGAVQTLLTNAIYLQDSSVEIAGLTIWGTPWTHMYKGGFNVGDRDGLLQKWRAIPAGIDVLLTHVPPHAVLDRAWDPRNWAAMADSARSKCTTCGAKHKNYTHWGCEHLLAEVTERIRPRLHAFGHVHDDPGTREIGGTIFANAAVDLHGKPLVVDLKDAKNKKN